MTELKALSTARKMLKSKTTGDVLVVDLDLKVASDWLHYDELGAPLGDYELDHTINVADFSVDDFTVIRSEGR